jgi:surface carbohydrate biosynthesis protein
MNTNIYIIIESASRELYANLHLAVALKESGYSVFLISQKTLANNIHKLPPGILLDKGYSANEVSRFKILKSRGFKIIIMRSEPIVYDRISFINGHKLSNINFDTIDIQLAIGKQHYNDLIDAGFPRNKIHILGNPRFSLLGTHMNEFIQRSEYKSNFPSKYILIVGNYPDMHYDINLDYSSNRYYSIHDNTHYLNIKKFNSSYEEHLYNSHLHRRIVYISFLNLINKLLTEFEDTLIVYRPHPSENPYYIKHLFKGISNFKVIYKYSAIEWIAHSLITIQNNCTTAIEAFLYGKPAISYKLIPKSIYDNEEVDISSISLYSESEVIDYLRYRVGLSNNNDPSISILNNNAAQHILSKYVDNQKYEDFIDLFLIEVDKYRVYSSSLIKRHKKLIIVIQWILLYLKRWLSKILTGNMIIQQIKGFNIKSVNSLLRTININKNDFKAIELQLELFEVIKNDK